MIDWIQSHTADDWLYIVCAALVPCLPYLVSVAPGGLS